MVFSNISNSFIGSIKTLQQRSYCYLLVLLFSTPLFAFEEGIRIAWDYNSRNNVTGGVYSRIKCLANRDLVFVYSAGPDVWIRKSSDQGATWTSAILVSHQDSYNNTNSEVIQLQNGWLLYAWNCRPTQENTIPYLIKTKLSKDQGLTWQNEQLIYTADITSANGCWEPSLLQLPSGEIQLFFANENPFRNNNDQEINMVRSFDNASSWTAPIATSYRVGERDGMPVPVYLQNNKGIVYAIEDPGYNGTFKPVIISTSVQDNWSSGTVNGSSPKRWGALRSDYALPGNVYAGAPYVIQLSTGETILSFQNAQNRTSDTPIMQVYIGDENAQNFSRPSNPLLLPTGGNAMWNALAALDENTIIATSSVYTGGSSNNGLWTIKGKVIRPLSAYQGNITVDGLATANEWSSPSSAFIGSQSTTNSTIKTAYDANFLYLYFEVQDKDLSADSDTPWDDDAVEIYLDPQNKNCNGVCDGMYKFLYNIGKKTLFSKGNNTTGWVDATPTGIQDAVRLQGTLNNASDQDQGYSIEIAIPWNQIGGKPNLNTGWGIHFKLHEDANGGAAEVHEDLSGNDANRATTFMRIDLRPESNGQGLNGNYFGGMQFEVPTLTRIDPQINFNWGNFSPELSIPYDSFSVRWLGYIQPSFNEDYTFYITSDNGRRLWIGDSLVIDQWVNDWDKEYTGIIHLTAGKKYPIRVEYFEVVGGANIVLSWSSKSQTKTMVPYAATYVPDNALRFPYYKISTIPGRIEAENFDLGSSGVTYYDTDATNNGNKYRTDEGIDIEASNDLGAGYDVGWIQSGEWIEYKVNVKESGSYEVGLRAATANAGGGLQVKSGNTVLGTIAVTKTGAWSTWQTFTNTLHLDKGVQTLRLQFVGGTGSLFNLNWISFKETTVTALEDNDLSSLSQPSVYPNPSTEAFEIRSTGTFVYHLYDLAGHEWAQGTATDRLILGQQLSMGMYLLQIQRGTKNYFKKLIKE